MCKKQVLETTKKKVQILEIRGVVCSCDVVSLRIYDCGQSHVKKTEEANQISRASSSTHNGMFCAPESGLPLNTDCGP